MMSRRATPSTGWHHDVRRYGREDSEGSAGFGLIEAIVSSALIAGLAVGVAQLVSTSRTAVRAAAHQTTGLLLAVQKMEQLRALPWRFDRSGLRAVSDFTTDLARDPPSAGGRGLAPSPSDSLAHSRHGYSDYLDARGRSLGGGGDAPLGTSYVRRWSIQPYGGAMRDILVIEVVVMPLRRLVGSGTSVVRLTLLYTGRSSRGWCRPPSSRQTTSVADCHESSIRE